MSVEFRFCPVCATELAEYKLISPEDVRCWPQGTGQAMATWLRRLGIEPKWIEPTV